MRDNNIPPVYRWAVRILNVLFSGLIAMKFDGNPS